MGGGGGAGRAGRRGGRWGRRRTRRSRSGRRRRRCRSRRRGCSRRRWRGWARRRGSGRQRRWRGRGGGAAVGRRRWGGTRRRSCCRRRRRRACRRCGRRRALRRLLGLFRRDRAPAALARRRSTQSAHAMQNWRAASPSGAVVASSTRRRFIMVGGPRKGSWRRDEESPEPSSRLVDQRLVVRQRIVAGEKTETLFISLLQRVACAFVQDAFRIKLATRNFNIVPSLLPVRRGIGRERSARPASRNLLRHLAGKLVRPRRLAGFTHRRRRSPGLDCLADSRRRLGRRARRCRRDFGRFDRHLHRHLAILAEIWSDNGAPAAMFLPGDGGTHAGLWQTASMLWPSGSSTNAP